MREVILPLLAMALIAICAASAVAWAPMDRAPIFWTTGGGFAR